MQPISDEVKEIFDDPEFGRILKVMATEFGANSTLENLHTIYELNRPVPEKIIDGKTYLAGYHGPFMIPEGYHKATLVDIKQNGLNCKLMFILQPLRPMKGKAGVFLYHNIPLDDLKVENIVKIAKYLGDDFPIKVKHEIITQTGDKHAIVESIEGWKI